MALEFDNIINFRDVGKTVNEFLGRKVIKEGVLYRSARPDDATLRDREKLRDELGIRTVIDLRTKTELLKQAEKRRADLRAGSAALQSNAALAEPAQIPGLRYLEIKITGGAFERFVLSQLSWLRFFQVIILYVLGYRMQAVSVVSREVMAPRGLVGMARETVDHSGEEIARALRALIEPGSLPLLVHCTQGKDRTGLLVALVLLAAGAPEAAAAHDYGLSEAGLARSETAADRAARLAEIREIGLAPAEDWARCHPRYMPGLARHLEDRYGGVAGYLDGLGLAARERERLVEVLGA